MKLLDGRALANELTQAQQVAVAALKQQGITPKLVVIMVGDDPASTIYTQSKQKRATKIGIASELKRLSAETTEADLLAVIRQLNADETVDGILVQLPLPKQINEDHIIRAIDPQKDVDGFSPVNLGQLWLNQPGLVACTPNGIMRLLAAHKIDVAEKKVVIVGRSNIVGRPLAALMLNANATVTIAHSRTADLKDLTKTADILVAAIGQPHFFGIEDVKEGAVVVDVGINRLEDGTVTGDVDFDALKEHVSAMTPVPRGVGPMTITMLMEQTIEIAKERANRG
ncbi:bifunctional methylenetetrahydrofolate dehydrogenase/methenyltetrahydrofolate cyclohydrolase FolD [Lactobacillus curvatus]|uniref:bifunctional methylenetetrahydrofolate dehydrogenase/methenyltetrahydrofolate cyclohydrolase FolD n=1 Tax=Latilactobacillus fragifolii TaxID=2814244 RepID=UPI0012AF09E0|nr:bifunctional methylenetetrahydrofolate dehydrogenase/methenyltetrahydrofolate cyclohydrolase FolD [Latilactobacillus fragifolii]MSD83682.1 bifunctional methylenetetrahydrofolate dehydrogenase/methenyltetrahydrofolate cyclohydrolase FolD [Latilactobacillus curvatus]MSE23875.1 bifunctional methylenetetrahydrofolate dehydrogenase/methenyltetrahydrofolate cyclohydrolase FolD [Latilactobacillus curvatus]